MPTRVSSLVAVLVIVSGCGPSVEVGEIVPVAPAAGLLTINGQPLAYHQVMVYPEGGRPASGITDEAGKFVLGTNREGDGAPVGTHPCSVIYVGPVSDHPEEGINEFTPPPAPAIKILPKYNDPKTSGLTLTIPSSGDQQLRIELQR